MIVAEQNYTQRGTLTCAQSTDIDSLKDNITSDTGLITPVAGTAVVDFVPLSPAKLNVFVWHAHTSTEAGATITTARYKDGAHTILLDTKTEPFIPIYTGATTANRPQERKQHLTMFRKAVPVRDLDDQIVGSVRFTFNSHPSAFEVGMLGAYSGTQIRNGHLSGGIRDVSNQSTTQTKTSTTHSGGVSSVQKTTIRDFSFALKDFTSSEKETFLSFAEQANQTFPLLLVPIPSLYFDGINYAHPGEEGGIVRLTSSVRFDNASALKADATDVYHAQNLGFRSWI